MGPLKFTKKEPPKQTVGRTADWRILVVDDDPEVHTVTRLALKNLQFAGRGVEILNAFSAAQARAVLETEDDIAIVLLDVVMEADDAGLRLVQYIRTELKNATIRIILRTGQPGQAPEEEVIVTYDINDYKAKTELTVQKLFASTVTALRAYDNLRSLDAHSRGLQQIIENSDARFQDLANYDALTNLPNRTLLIDRVTQSISLARRTGQQLAMLCLDLDGFKFINDGFGHAVGDTLLKMVAARLKGAVRECDTVARLGGDEFALILFGLADDSRDVGSMAQRVLDTFAQPFIADAHELHVTASIGVSVFPSDGDTHDVLLKNADVAMHSAKERGRNCFQFYAQEMSLRAEQRVTLESALRTALERQQFEVHYQPKVDLRSGKVSGVEALLRWRHPEHGMVQPDSFIGLAEETRLIVPIGEWVLRTACAQTRKWHDMGFDDLSVAVNLSARQFEQQDIAQLVRQVLAETGLAARHLELELTESVLMSDSDVMLKALHEIKELGVVLTLDDFGTGYSSLSYLKRFPIDVLKIDRSFIRNVTTDVDDASLTKGIILLAQSLKMKTVAEGVETQGQLGFLSANKCDAVQGFYFSRPVTADALSAMLQSNLGLPVMPETAGRRRTVLLLDDEPNMLSALARLFRKDGYQILQAHTPAEGFELLATHRVQVIISDQRMPLMTGTAFLGKVKELYPDTIRIILSGYTELTSVIDAINGGAVYRFFTKPWDDQVLRDQLREAFEHHWLIYGKPTQDDQARAP
ncbi:MAG: EAL domain-containing protein [Oxalobacteraceae bacterium]|nr:EAL domain-containing protein [Oxalobacteraceae bacterium]